MGTGPKNRVTYLWGSHKRPTFQFQVQFTPSLFELATVIKENTIVGWICVKWDVGMAIHMKSLNQEVVFLIVACVLRTPTPT